VAGIQCLEDVVGLFAVSDFTDDQSVGAHAKGVLHQISDIEPSVLRRLAGQLPRVDAFELDPVRVVQLELGGVFDRNHALVFGERTDDRTKQGALSRAGRPGDQDVRASDGHGLEEGPHLRREPARSCPTRLAGIALVR